MKLNFYDILMKNSIKECSEDYKLNDEDDFDMTNKSFEILRLELSKKERKVLWKPWRHALNVKVISKSLPYSFLFARLQ